MKFDLICIDMFQTLVNVDSRIPYIWKRILGDNYNEPLAIKCAELISKNISSEFHENTSNYADFVYLKTMFKPYFKMVLEALEIPFDAEDAVKIFIEEHAMAAPYDDAELFFETLGDVLPICLVTDADKEMVLPLLSKYPFCEVYLSAEVKSYKNDPSGRIFKEVFKRYPVQPSRVLHIGDSSSDIIGAHRIGMHTCWINRNNLIWTYHPEPDYIIHSLVEAIGIIKS